MTHLGDLLSAHLDGELADHERSRVASHLHTCRRCRDELSELATARAALRALPILELPVVVARTVGVAPVPLPVRRRPFVWASAAAVAAVAVFVGAAIVTAPEPQRVSPPQLSAVYGAVSSNEPGFAAVKVAVASNAVLDGAR